MKIGNMLAKMFAILPEILSENREFLSHLAGSILILVNSQEGSLMTTCATRTYLSALGNALSMHVRQARH